MHENFLLIFVDTTTIISFQTKNMKLLTKQQESYENTKICYICKERFEIKYLKGVVKLEIIVIIQENIEVLRIAYVI